MQKEIKSMELGIKKLIDELEYIKNNSKKLGYDYVLLPYTKISDILNTLNFIKERI